MPQMLAVAEAAAMPVVQSPSIPAPKPGVNPSAFYTYAELEELGFGKYLKFRLAIRKGKLRAHYSGRNVLILGADLLEFIGAKK